MTGLAINSGKPTVPKTFRRNIRAAVHNAFHNGIAPDLQKTLEGQIGHIALCHQAEAKKLRAKLAQAKIVYVKDVSGSKASIVGTIDLDNSMPFDLDDMEKAA